MHRNTIRLALAGIAIFYVVFGSLWATNYFPLRKFYQQNDITMNSTVNSKGVDWDKTPEYRKADDYITKYALTHPDPFVIEARVGLYQALLLWGTVALAVGAAVLFLTRGMRAG